MKESLVGHLVCPIDGTPLELVITEVEGGEIKTGELRSSMGRTYAIQRFIPRFVDADRYATTFSKQRELARKHFDQYRLNFDDHAAKELFVDSTGFDLTRLDGITLDAGCGYGRFLRVVDNAGGEIIGVDLSTSSVDLAFDFVGRRDRVHIVQADLTKLPFRKAHFRRAFSIGVLHHTPDTRASFEKLPAFVEHGGEIAIWVYAPEKKISSDRWRKITTKLPLSVVYSWCVLNEVLFAPFRSLPRGGGRIGSIIPGGTIATPFWMRVMSDFDDLTPRYAYTHRANEVRDWFIDCGLIEVRVLERPTAVRGSRPRAP